MSSLSSLGSRRTTSCEVEDGGVMVCMYMGLGVYSHSCPQCVQSALLQCYAHHRSWDEFAKQPVHNLFKQYSMQSRLEVKYE